MELITGGGKLVAVATSCPTMTSVVPLRVADVSVNVMFTGMVRTCTLTFVVKEAVAVEASTKYPVRGAVPDSNVGL